uniref:hypothetical protein n=1 Tax=Yoonia sp. TaxID=2212373 RepID=UPI0040487642
MRKRSVNYGGRSTIRASIRGAIIPRGVREHKFVRTVSTNNGSVYGTAQQILIGIDQNRGFVVNGAVQGSYNMALTFSLTGMNLWFAGTYFGTISVPGASDFTSLYEQYKIEFIEISFYFSNNISNLNSTATSLPIMGIVRDFDDVLATDMFALQQFSGYQMWQLGNQRGDGAYKMRVKPAAQTLTYNGSGGTTVSGIKRDFSPTLSINTPSIPHYGVKIAYDPVQQLGSDVANVVGFLSINATYHLSMRNTR